jgi:hypothetical protein
MMTLDLYQRIIVFFEKRTWLCLLELISQNLSQQISINISQKYSQLNTTLVYDDSS